MYISKCSGMDHSVLPANTPCLPFLRMRSPDGATSNWGKWQSNCRLLLIYRPRRDERLSWPGWLTYSGRFTHISGQPSAPGRAWDRESSPAKDRRSTTEPRNQPLNTVNTLVITSPLHPLQQFILFRYRWTRYYQPPDEFYHSHPPPCARLVPLMLIDLLSPEMKIHWISSLVLPLDDLLALHQLCKKTAVTAFTDYHLVAQR